MPLPGKGTPGRGGAWALKEESVSRKLPREEFFWPKVLKGPGCWAWKASRNPWGYGQFGKTGAHRAAWIFTHGPIPSGLHVCHRCDHPYCVNPDHLFLGTPAENVADAKRKGHYAWGDRKPGVKLHPINVIGAKLLWNLGYSQRFIAKLLGVSFQTIWKIVHNYKWNHLFEREKA